MGIDVNDVKILINGGFHYLIKTCYQWAKDHPLVSGVMSFFYLLYIFLPSLFSMLFYTFPLVTCVAILLGKPRISLEKRPQSDIKSSSKIEEKSRTISDNATSSGQCRHPYLTSQMSRRTFGKDKSKIEGISKENKEAISSSLLTWDDPVINKIIEEEILPLKIKKETLNFMLFENIPSSTTSTMCSDIDSEDNYEPQEERKKLVEWTEDDQWNLMDLGSSEIERNERLESLIAKRRARKQLSMQPRRNPLNYMSRHPSFDHHIDQVGVIARAFDDIENHHNLVSTFLMKRSRDPFDIPYDSLEERPVLTGGGFEEDLFSDNVDKNESNRGGSNSLGEYPPPTNSNLEHPLAKSLPSFFLKKPGFTRFRGGLDVGEGIEDIPEELYQEGKHRTPKGQNTPKEGQLYRTYSAPNDQSPRFPPEEGKFEGETFAQNVEPMRSDSISSTEAKNEKEPETKDSTEDNIKRNSDPTVVKQDEVQLSQPDHMSENKAEEDDDDSSSSSSSSNDTQIDATKNEAFRNSVKKVLTCLVVRPRNKGLSGKEILGASSSDPVQDSTPITAILPTTTTTTTSSSTTTSTTTTTKMDERSLYTNKPLHVKTFSIASDMQVEVSDPNSPTDRESLVYDADVDKDANSGDEDLWSDSPHPAKLVPLGQLGAKFRLPDIIEESSFEIAHNADELPPTLSRALGEEAHLARGETSFTSSPRSILPEDNNNNQEVVDQKSTNADILEPISSCSSASSSSPTSTSRTKGIASQLPGKSQHLAEYLSSLPPSGIESSNTLEDPGPSHIGETSAEVISVQDESNAIFEVEEDKDDSKQSKELKGSRENSEQTTSTRQPEAPTEVSLASHEDVNSELLNKHKDSNPTTFNVERNDHSKTLEDGSKAVAEDDFAVRGSQGHENEVNSGSLSTTPKENIIDRSISTEESNPMSEKDKTITSGSLNEGEVKSEPPSNLIMNEKSTSPEKPTTEANQSVNDLKKLEVDEASKEDTDKTQERKGEPQSGVEEDNKKPTTEANQSVNDMNKLEVDKASKEDTEKTQERKGEPQSGVEEDNKKPTAEANQSVNDMNKLEVDKASKEDTEKTQEIKGEPRSGVEEDNKKPTAEANQSVNDMNKLEVDKASKEDTEKTQEIKSEPRSGVEEDNKKPTAEANQSVNAMKKLEVNEASKEDTEKTQERKGEPQSGVEVDNKKPSSAPLVIHST